MKNSLAKYAIILLCLSATNSAFSQVIPEKNILIQGFKTKDFIDYPKKVYIKNFKVYYQMIAEAEKTNYGGRQIGGGSYTGDATARMAVGVEGISVNDLQELTNDLYNRYRENLQDAGLEIITNEDLMGMEFFQDWDLLQGPRINQEQIPGSLMVVPADFSYYVKKVNKKGKEKTGGFMAGITGTYGEFTGGTYGPVPKLSEQLDDAMVVEVIVNVPSIWLDAKAKLGTAKVKGGPYLRLQNARVTYVSGETSKPGVAAPDAGLEITVSKEIPINGVFAEEKFKTVATKSRTSVPDYAPFFTVENTTVELTNTIECDAAVYKDEVGKTLNAYLDMTVDKLKMGLAGEKVK